MTRVPLEHRRTLFVRAMEIYSRKAYGKVLEPGLVALHNRRVLKTMLKTERSAAKWNKLDPTLAALATIGAAATVGCQWCMDFGYWVSHHEGIAADKLRDVPRWQQSDVYTPLERRVLAYAEAMSVTPLTVTDEMVAGLREELDDAEVVELTALIALENQRARTNDALGLTAQGFKESCELMPQ